MIIAASSEKMLPRRRRSEDNPNRLDASGKSTASVRTTYIGADPRELKDQQLPAPSMEEHHPMAFLIEQGADATLNTHFHKVDQFQIFINGDGSIGNHVITEMGYQFAGAYSPYGPIIAGPRGIDYLTLRNNYISKAYFMPKEREERRAGNTPHREVVGHITNSPSAEALAAMREVVSSTLAAPAADGLAVWRYTVPPNGTTTGPAPSTGGGQFWIVLAGELLSSDGPMPRGSTIYVSAEEAAYVAKAGAGGLDVLVAQFPAKHSA